jgi:hypothetical protein
MVRLNQTSLGTTVRSAIVAATAAAVFGAPEWIRAFTQLGEILAEFARSLLIAYVLAHLVVRARVRGWKGAFLLGALLCVFQAVVLLGSLIHEHMPLLAYAVRGAYAAGSTLVAVALLGFCKVFAPGGRDKDAHELVPDPHPLASARTRPGVNYKAVVLAAVAAIVVGSIWYSPLVFGGAWAHLKSSASVGGAKIPPAEVLGELVRSAVMAYLLARFISIFRVAWKGSLLLAGAVWLGFHATLLLFSVIHEHMPVALFAIHAGHGLANDLVIAAIVGGWRAKVHATASVNGAATSAAAAPRALEG